MTDISHDTLLFVLVPLVFGSYLYMWHSFNRLWDQRGQDIKEVTAALQAFTARLDKAFELLAEKGVDTEKEKK